VSTAAVTSLRARGATPTRSVAAELGDVVQRCTTGVWRRARPHDRAGFMPDLRGILRRHERCICSTQSRSNGAIPMATEVVILGVTVSLYLLCALFVRVCDRI